jgi:hypothetical protein
MKTFIAIALILAVLHSSSYAKESCPEFKGADKVIYHTCKSRWPDDFHMLKYCIDNQEEALSDLKKRFCSVTKDEEKL